MHLYIYVLLVRCTSSSLSLRGFPRPPARASSSFLFAPCLYTAVRPHGDPDLGFPVLWVLIPALCFFHLVLGFSIPVVHACTSPTTLGSVGAPVVLFTNTGMVPLVVALLDVVSFCFISTSAVVVTHDFACSIHVSFSQGLLELVLPSFLVLLETTCLNLSSSRISSYSCSLVITFRVLQYQVFLTDVALLRNRVQSVAQEVVICRPSVLVRVLWFSWCCSQCSQICDQSLLACSAERGSRLC